MNLQENIKKVLREETDFSPKFKRRLNRFKSFVWDNNVTNYPCDFENFEAFMRGIQHEIMDMITDGSDTDGPLSDWLTYKDGVTYVENYMRDDLERFYNKECVDVLYV
jgi:hypothetical protein